LDGRPIATSNVFWGAGVAGVQMVSTLPKARGKGIGSAITLAPLLDSKKMGCRVGTLQSSEMGYLIYKKMGFQHLCQMEYFHHMLNS
jgi:predicted acetyltransferase